MENTEKIEKSIQQQLAEKLPFKHAEIGLICISGSNSNGSSGRLSDVDITTVMNPENKNKFNFESILTLSSQLRQRVFELARDKSLICPVIATIRLEEAQTTMAEMLNPNNQVLPIHWLHYPSVEFAVANEPPELFRGLISGSVLMGDKNSTATNIDKAESKCVANLSGLDWITDSFRVFLANRNDNEFIINIQDDRFLKKLATHNLEYFWKWKIIRPFIKNRCGFDINNWKDAEKHSSAINSDVWNAAVAVRQIRHQGSWANSEDIISLHRETFKVWFNL